MMYGISGAPVPISLPYAATVEAACGEVCPPCFMYAIAYRESIRGELAGEWPSAADVQADDGGLGLCQITPEEWWPQEMRSAWASLTWQSPLLNTKFAIRYFVLPAMAYWHAQGFDGDNLAKLVACEYNAGRSNTILGHEEGNADKYTTGGDYGSFVVRVMNSLLLDGKPE